MDDQRWNEFVGHVRRLDEDPDEVIRLADSVRSRLLASEQDDGDDDLWREIFGLDLVMDDGDRVRLGDLVENDELLPAVSFDEELDTSDYFGQPRMKRMGSIPVTRNDDLTGAVPLRHLCPLVSGRTGSRNLLFDTRGTAEHRSFWAYKDCFWATPFILPFCHYWAYTKVRADGLDGAEFCGGLYAIARAMNDFYEARLSNQAVPAEYREDHRLWMMIREQWRQEKDKWESIAKESPACDYPANAIATRVCGAHKPVGSDYRCSTATGSHTHRVSATLTIWAPFPLAVRSYHRVNVDAAHPEWTAMVSTYDGTIVPFQW